MHASALTAAAEATSVADLKTEKRALQKELHQYETTFQQRHGHAPKVHTTPHDIIPRDSPPQNNIDRLPMMAQYRRYKVRGAGTCVW